MSNFEPDALNATRVAQNTGNRRNHGMGGSGVNRRQGKASFGDAGVFVEKYVQRARHIEVQIFGDGKGGIVTLPERECSIQRRHQKVVEESPSPYVGEHTPHRLCDPVPFISRRRCLTWCPEHVPTGLPLSAQFVPFAQAQRPV